MPVSDIATLNKDVSHGPNDDVQSAVPRSMTASEVQVHRSVWGPVGWAVGFVLALGIMLMYGAGGSVNNDFTQNVWLPSRLLLNGANPYDPAPAQVSAALGSYASQFQGFNSGENFHFIYPMWVALLFTPLALLPLTAALALWRSFNLLLLVWGVVRILKSSGAAFRVSRAPVVAAIILTTFLALIYRESLLTLFLGQFSVIEFALLAAIWGYLVSGSSLTQSETGKRVLVAGDVLVGMALAVLATKPQAVGLPVILLGLWALSRRRWAIPASAVGTLALLLFVPLLAFPSSLGDWLGIVTSGQAGSQASVSASVWGVSYQLLSGSFPWAWIAVALTLVGLATLIPHWRRDLTDRTAPAPMSLALTLCVGLVISPYMLGYEHVLLLFPALLMLAAAGLPDQQSGRNWKLWRMAVYAWMAALPFLIVALQVGLSSKEYPVIVQSLTMLALVYVARFKWKSAVGET